jgi:hypothetical protein
LIISLSTFQQYFKLEDVPNQMFEKHVLYELSPGPFGCVTKKINPSDELPHM